MTYNDAEATLKKAFGAKYAKVLIGYFHAYGEQMLGEMDAEATNDFSVYAHAGIREAAYNLACKELADAFGESMATELEKNIMTKYNEIFDELNAEYNHQEEEPDEPNFYHLGEGYNFDLSRLTQAEKIQELESFAASGIEQVFYPLLLRERRTRAYRKLQKPTRTILG